MKNPRVAPFFCIAALLACAGDGPSADDDGPRTEVTDSAGVTLVRNAGGAVPDSALAPDLVVGTVDGPEELQFFRIMALAVTPDGGMLVSDRSGTVREFDAAGAFRGRYGSRGDGPGEFQLPMRLFALGDTIAVVDQQHFRLTGLRRSGGAPWTASLRENRAVTLPVAPVEGAWLVEWSQMGEWNLEVGKPRRDTVRIGLVRADPMPAAGLAADTPHTIVRYPRGRLYGIASAMGGMTANSPLWEPQPAHAVDGTGAIYVSMGQPYRIDVHDTDGALVRRITRAHAPVPVTTALVDRYWHKVNTFLDTTTARHGEWDITVDAERGRRDLPVNETLPALGRLIVSSEGVLWANRPDLSPDPLLLAWTREQQRQDTFWDVFDNDGAFIATVRLPAAFRPIAAGGRAIYGVLRDDLDVEHLARFTLPAAS